MKFMPTRLKSYFWFYSGKDFAQTCAIVGNLLALEFYWRNYEAEFELSDMRAMEFSNRFSIFSARNPQLTQYNFASSYYGKPIGTLKDPRQYIDISPYLRTI